MPIVLPKSLGFTWRPLPRNSAQPLITKEGFRGWVLHTAVSNGSSLYDFFNGRSAGVESTLYVRQHGGGEQYMHVDRRADCQLDGNWWSAFGGSGFASMESWDGAGTHVWNGRDVNDCPPWTDEQVDSITDVLAWSSKPDVLNYPIEKATGPHGYGIGYHAQFTGGSVRWNEHHACPTRARIDQMPHIIALAKQKASSTTIPLGEDDDMQLNQIVKIGQWVKDRWDKDEGIQDGIQVETALSSGYAHARAAHDNTQGLKDDVAELKKLVKDLTEKVEGN